MYLTIATVGCSIADDDLGEAARSDQDGSDEGCATAADDGAPLDRSCEVAAPRVGDTIGRSRDRASDTLERDRTEQGAPLGE